MQNSLLHSFSCKVIQLMLIHESWFTSHHFRFRLLVQNKRNTERDGRAYDSRKLEFGTRERKFRNPWFRVTMQANQRIHPVTLALNRPV